MDEDSLLREAARAAEIIRRDGPCDEAELERRLIATGTPEDVVREVIDIATDEHQIWTLGRQNLCATQAQVSEGQVATHRLTGPEVEHGFVLIYPDLVVPTMGFDSSIEAARGGLIEVVSASSRPGLPIDWHDEAVVGPPGWLAGLRAGDLVAMSVQDGRLAVGGADPGPDAGIPALLADTFAASMCDDGTAFTTCIAGLVAVTSPDAFAVPRRPFGELLDAAGLSTSGDLVAASGLDWDEYWEGKRLAFADVLSQDHRLDHLDGRLLADLIVQGVHFSVGATLDDAAWEAVATAFAAPRVTESYLSAPDGGLGLFGDAESVARVRRFAEAAIAAWKGRPPAGAELTVGRCAEFEGDLVTWEARVGAALRIDPDFPPALLDAALLASLRGQASRARTLLARSGTRDATLEAMLEYYASPGAFSAARNDPCPCGSGRKHKACCEPWGGHGLRDRVLWLYQKAAAWVNRPAARRVRLPLACAAASEDIDDAPDPGLVVTALADEDLADLQLFDGGALEQFVEVARPMLPSDEAALLDRWVSARHRLWALVERPPDHQPWTLRDEVTGETVSVLDLPGA
ncbi:MAG: SEC-C domain-containing protein, partial [Acidimicrobiales bacterium]